MVSVLEFPFPDPLTGSLHPSARFAMAFHVQPLDSMIPMVVGHRHSEGLKVTIAQFHLVMVFPLSCVVLLTPGGPARRA
jgi:hypothetical protein